MWFCLIGCSIFVKESPKGFSNKGNQYANTTKEANPLDTGWGYCTCAVRCPSWGPTHRSHDLALFRSQTHILEWSSQVPQWDSSICLSLQIRCVWSKEAVKDGGLVWKKTSFHHLNTFFFTVRCENNNRENSCKWRSQGREILKTRPVAAAVRQHIVCDIKKRFKTVEEAEDPLGLTLESYLDESNTSAAAKPPATLDISQSLIEKMGHMTPSQLKELIEEAWQLHSKLPTLETDIKEVDAKFQQDDSEISFDSTKIRERFDEISWRSFVEFSREQRTKNTEFRLHFFCTVL